VIAAGVPRNTGDIDVTVESPRTGTRGLVDALTAHGLSLRDVGDVPTFIAQTRVIPALHTATDLPVDVVLAGPGLEEEMLARVVMRRIGRNNIPFVDTADLIALKVLAGRDKDLEDVRALLRASPADLSPDVARKRVAELGALIDDTTLVATFDRLAVAPTRSKPAATSRRRSPARTKKTKR